MVGKVKEKEAINNKFIINEDKEEENIIIEENSNNIEEEENKSDIKELNLLSNEHRKINAKK